MVYALLCENFPHVLHVKWTHVLNDIIWNLPPFRQEGRKYLRRCYDNNNCKTKISISLKFLESFSGKKILLACYYAISAEIIHDKEKEKNLQNISAHSYPPVHINNLC